MVPLPGHGYENPHYSVFLLLNNGGFTEKVDPGTTLFIVIQRGLTRAGFDMMGARL
jgi:hypothetical protein